MREDTVFAAGVAALGAPVIALAHVLLTGVVPDLRTLALTVTAVAITAWCLSRPAAAAGAVWTTGRRTAVTTAALLAGQLVFALQERTARTDGCLPTVGRGARVGAGWLTLRPVTPCADGGLAGTSLSLAAAVTALGLVLTALAVVLGHLSVALAAALVTHGVRVAGSLVLPLLRLVTGRLSSLMSFRDTSDRRGGTRTAHPGPTVAVPSPSRRWVTPVRRGPPRPGRLLPV